MALIEYDPSSIAKEYLEGILAYHHNIFTKESSACMVLNPYKISSVDSALWVNGFISQLKSKPPFDRK